MTKRAVPCALTVVGISYTEISHVCELVLAMCVSQYQPVQLRLPPPISFLSWRIAASGDNRACWFFLYDRVMDRYRGAGADDNDRETAVAIITIQRLFDQFTRLGIADILNDDSLATSRLQVVQFCARKDGKNAKNTQKGG